MEEIDPKPEITYRKMSRREAAATTGGIALGMFGTTSLAFGAGRLGMESVAIESGTFTSLATSALILGKYAIDRRPIVPEQISESLSTNFRRAQMIGAKAALVAHIILKI